MAASQLYQPSQGIDSLPLLPSSGTSTFPMEDVSAEPVMSPQRRRIIMVSQALLSVVYAAVVTVMCLAVWQIVTQQYELHIVAWCVAAFFVGIAVPLSLHDIHMHMLHYRRPDIQRYYIRILFLVPIYAIEVSMLGAIGSECVPRAA